jgi:hypothetical protein
MLNKDSIIEEFELGTTNCSKTIKLCLVGNESKSGVKYKSCCLCVGELSYYIGFDKLYFTLKKILKGGNI